MKLAHLVVDESSINDPDNVSQCWCERGKRQLGQPPAVDGGKRDGIRRQHVVVRGQKHGEIRSRQEHHRMREIVPRLQEGVKLTLDLGTSAATGRAYTEEVEACTFLARAELARACIIGLGHGKEDQDESDVGHDHHDPRWGSPAHVQGRVSSDEAGERKAQELQQCEDAGGRGPLMQKKHIRNNLWTQCFRGRVEHGGHHTSGYKLAKGGRQGSPDRHARRTQGGDDESESDAVNVREWNPKETLATRGLVSFEGTAMSSGPSFLPQYHTPREGH